ncbi:MAG: hypothetical protein CMJ19_02825 [Phycisphaeraceae bacterium]|nr:hypothetical protein [Phycisphaeraceae bacterium]
METMHKIIITSTKFNGSLEFEMDDTGTVKLFKNFADLDSNQLDWFSGNFPITLDRLNALIRKSKNLKAELVEADLSFDHFWNKYGMKRNRIRAEKWWNKLKDADKIMALRNLDAYEAYLQRNPQQAKLYPDTYLNPNERKFENDYKS